MNRYPGLVARDPETGNVWVCIGGSDARGWQWCWVGPTGGIFYAWECPDDVLGHPSFKRALSTIS